MIMAGLSDDEDSVSAIKKRARQVCSVRVAPEAEPLKTRWVFSIHITMH